MAQGREYKINGLGGPQPLVIRNSDVDFFDVAMKVCEQERALIIEEIVKKDVAKPSNRYQEWSGSALTLTFMPFNERAPTFEIHDPVEEKRSLRANSFSTRLSLLAASIRGRLPPWPSRINDIAEAIISTARPGTIILHGDTTTISSIGLRLRRKERTCILLPIDRIDVNDIPKSEKYSNDSFILRQKHNQFYEYLRSSFVDAESIGAIVFIGPDDFSREIEIVLDYANAPPIFTGTSNQSSHIEFGRIDNPAINQPLPRITVVGVSFNQAKYLERSILSVISQNYPNLEYIMIDGGSTDGSTEIIERYRSFFSSVTIETDTGQSNALNKGFRQATGEVMNWLCSDDLLMPGSLVNIGRAYIRHNTDFIVGGCLRIDDESRKLYHHYSTLPFGLTVAMDPLDIMRFMQSWRKGHYFFQPDIFFTRRIWNLSGGFLKEHLYYLMDYDLWLRMALAGAKARCIPAPIGCSRVQANQKTRDEFVNLHEAASLIGEYHELYNDILRMKKGIT